MTDQPTADPIGETTPETARALLWRHGLPEDVIDGALALFAQELAGKIRAHRDHTRGAVQATKVMDFAADLISPEHWARTVPAVPVSSPPPDQTAEPVCKFAEGCHRVVPCDPGCGTPPPDQTRDRDRYAEVTAAARAEANRLALSESLGLGTGAPWAAIRERVAALAVLPPPADRAAVLREAADFAEQLMDERYGPDCSYGIGGLDVARELRRLAAEAQQPDTETQACAHSDGCDGECPCPPSCGCCTVTAAPGTEMPNTTRAAVYREVADRLTTDAHGMQPDWARIYKRDAAVKVREWAEQLDGEGRQGEPSDGIAVSRTHSEP